MAERHSQDFRTIDQLTLEPRNRTDTMPATPPRLTLGYQVIAWIYDNLTHPDGDRIGQPFQVTKRQALFLLHWYAVNEDGEFIHRAGARRLAKGSGKSPFAAVHALAELLGPVRFDRFDDDVPGGVVGKDVPMAEVVIAATSEAQTRNTMRNITAMAHKGGKLARKYKLDVGKSYVERSDGGRLSQITSSAPAAEGKPTSFAIADETEHWTPGNYGNRLAETLSRNGAKLGGRLLETSNAWDPGASSVAESTYEAWVAEQESRLNNENGELLYDAIIAPANTALTDNPKEGEISLTEGLEYVYADTPWVKLRSIKADIGGGTDPSLSRQFFLNQPTARSGAWVAPHQWSKLAAPDRELVDGEDIVMFFDGSKSNDHTALVGCCMSDGHIFTIGVWEPQDLGGNRKEVNVDAVDAAVLSTREEFNVVGFWADVREFESYVKNAWPEAFAKDNLLPAGNSGRPSDLIAWDMRTKGTEFALNAEMTRDEIVRGEFTHDGNSTTGQHITNAVSFESRGRISIRKESPKSPRKIDAAVCVIGARMLYRAVRESPNYLRSKRKPVRILF